MPRANRLTFSRACASIASAVAVCATLTGCVELRQYRTALPGPGGAAECLASPASGTAGVPACVHQSTEKNARYTMHVVEFDDEGWPFLGGDGQAQIDSAIAQLKDQLKNSSDCVRLFVYVHGWRHNAKATDTNVVNFREFLGQVAAATTAATAAGKDACEDPSLAAVAASQKPAGTSLVVRKARAWPSAPRSTRSNRATT